METRRQKLHNPDKVQKTRIHPRRNNHSTREVTTRTKAIMMNELKDKTDLLEHNERLEQDIRQAAHSIGRLTEANAFINEMTTKRTHRAVADL